MSYQLTELKEEISIKKVISLHYFEYMSDFTFPGESHNFWEFMYVDKGEVYVTADREKLQLRQGQIIFHKPNEFHALAADNVIAPNLVVMSFESVAPCMAFFENKILTVSDQERSLLAQIIMETRDTFDGPMDDPYMEQLIRKADIPFGAEQMIKIHLEQLLIRLIRSNLGMPIRPKSTRGEADKLTGHDKDSVFGDILSYLEKNITQQLTVDKISRDNLISVSKLKKLFHTYLGTGVMDYFNQMKIDAAKQLIRNQQMNFTQIADFLGYTSVHYFSRNFKSTTNMTPSEYRASILRRASRPERSTL